MKRLSLTIFACVILPIIVIINWYIWILILSLCNIERLFPDKNYIGFDKIAVVYLPPWIISVYIFHRIIKKVWNYSN